ncbi:MAG: hypothetical protein AAF717_22800 [Bacteroidota bacterium]
MVTKVLNIDVKDNEVEELEDKLKGVNVQIKRVEGESQKADSALKKVGDNGGAISTLDALTGGAATRIRDAAEASKLFTINLKGIRGALLATGIGALVVALGTVVAYWDDIKTFVTGVNVDLENQLELQKEIAKEAEFNLQVLESSENILRLQGKSEQEIVNLKKERLKEIIKISEEELLLQQQQLEFIKNSESTLQSQSERFVRFFGQVAIKIAELLDKATGGIFNFSKSAGIATIGGFSILESIFGNEEEISNIENNIDELTLKLTKARDRLASIELNGRTGVRGEDQEELVLPTTGITLVQLEELGQQEFDALALQQNARTRLEDEEAKNRIKIAELESAAKVESFMLAAEGFATASRLVGQETAAGKAFAVASTLISTYLSAQKAYESQFQPLAIVDSPVRGAIAAAVATAAGFANVKEILRVPVPGGGGVGVPSISSPSTPPAFNVIDSSPENQLNQALLERNNEPIEAFVVDKNVTSSQEARRNKIEASSFG